MIDTEQCIHPLLNYVDNRGNTVQQRLNFGSSSNDSGETYNIMYNPADGKILTLGFVLVITFYGSILFSVVLGICSFGIFFYALNKPMQGYLVFVSKFSFNFFIPFLMISFELLLIYGLFYGNSVPFYISVLLVFFIICLGFGIWGYLRNTVSKVSPKLKKFSTSKWIVGNRD